MAELDLGVRPCQRPGPLEGERVVMVPEPLQHRLAARADERPEGDAGGSARRHAHRAADAEDGIEHGAGGVGKRSLQCLGRREIAADADEPRPVRLVLHRPDRHPVDDCEMCRPEVFVGRRPLPAMRDEGIKLRDVFGLHEQFREGRMRHVGRTGAEHDLGIGGYFDVPPHSPHVGERDAPDLGIAFGRDEDFRRRGDSAVAADELGMVLGEVGDIGVGLRPGRLVGRGPGAAGLGIAEIDPGAPVVEGPVLAPAGHALLVPATPPGSRIGQHDRVAAIGEDLDLRGRRVRRRRPAGRLRHDDAHLGRRLDLLGPHLDRSRAAWMPFLQQELDRGDDRLAVEAPAHLAAEQRIGDGHDGHALVVSHVVADDCEVFAGRHATRRVVDRLEVAIVAERALIREHAVVRHRRRRIDHRRKARRIGGNDGVGAEPALQAEAGHPEIGILVGELEVAGVIGGFRYSPGDAFFRPVRDLAGDDEAVGLGEQAPVRCTHHQRGHQVLEHRARPGDQCRAAGDVGGDASHSEPVLGGHIALGDGEEAREPRFRGQQIVVVGVALPVARQVSDRQELALGVVEEAVVHRYGEAARRVGEC